MRCYLRGIEEEWKDFLQIQGRKQTKSDKLIKSERFNTFLQKKGKILLNAYE